MVYVSRFGRKPSGYAFIFPPAARDPILSQIYFTPEHHTSPCCEQTGTGWPKRPNCSGVFPRPKRRSSLTQQLLPESQLPCRPRQTEGIRGASHTTRTITTTVIEPTARETAVQTTAPTTSSSSAKNTSTRRRSTIRRLLLGKRASVILRGSNATMTPRFLRYTPEELMWRRLDCRNSCTAKI